MYGFSEHRKCLSVSGDILAIYEREKNIRSLKDTLGNDICLCIINQELNALPNRGCIGIQEYDLRSAIYRIYNYTIRATSLEENLRWGSPSAPNVITASFVRRVLETMPYKDVPKEICIALDELEQPIDSDLLAKFRAEYEEYAALLRARGVGDCESTSFSTYGKPMDGMGSARLAKGKDCKSEVDDDVGRHCVGGSVAEVPLSDPVHPSDDNNNCSPDKVENVTVISVKRVKTKKRSVTGKKSVETMTSSELKEYLKEKKIPIPTKGSGSSGTVVKADLFKIAMKGSSKSKIEIMSVSELKEYLLGKGIKIPKKGSGSGGNIIKGDLLKLAIRTQRR